MTKREIIAETLPEALFLDGHDNAIIGIVELSHTRCVAYSKAKVLANLMKMGMGSDEAQEFFDFNIVGAYMGEHTPCYLERL